ncbi:MAG TPA: carboxypeptidase-like regulatory domain-containing protein [Chitinophagaceae bacterium]|jgi:hypothetical protein|nr:carboxypeptidase-like regulatory domain-containing protein [Chitinophagaceae bacterium]
MKLVAALSLLLIVLNCRSQTCTISGVIKDATGNPVSRVTIQSESSNAGSASKTDGSFAITVAKGERIRSTCLGYGSFQYTVNSDAILEIQLPVEPMAASKEGFIQPGILRGKIIFEIQSRSFIIPPVQIIKYLPEGEKMEDENKIFSKVEVPPSYNGGMKAFCRRLAKMVTQKTDSRDHVHLKFFIGQDGYSSNIQVLSSSNKDLETEIISAFPKLTWYPAVQNGPGYGVWCMVVLYVKKDNGEIQITLE